MMNYVHILDIGLHIETGEELSYIFLSMDRMKYKKMLPRYIADLYDLRKNHPDHFNNMYEEYVEDMMIYVFILHLSRKKTTRYLSGNRKNKVTLKDKTVNMREAKDLYGRLMILTKSNCEIDQKHAIGNFEFTVTSRTLLPCIENSKFIFLLVMVGEAD